MAKFLLLVIFFLGLVLRFLYFPQNTYFGFDQARDAYASMEIIQGHFKIVGPPTAGQVFHHGVLYYYIFAPIYLIWGGDPIAVSSFLRILNVVCIFPVFLITFLMFGEIVAILASFLFAISYEQTQFSLFLNHPSLAIVSVLIFYLGLSFWIFKKRNWGLILALFGLGLSIQFEFVEIQLIPIFILFFLYFAKNTPKLNLSNILIGFVAFILPVSSFIVSEAVHNFYILRQIPDLILGNSGRSNFTTSSITKFLFFINRHFHDNLIAADYLIVTVVELVFVIILIKIIFLKNYKKQIVFLILWFFGGLLVYFFTDNDAYFYNTGTSIALLIFAGFILSKLYLKNKWITFMILFLVLLSNISLIAKNNPLGPNEKINPQKGLLLEDEERIIDFIYQKANGKNFAVNALTMPYNINTTWSYLFEWYGKKKYGYVPVWGGDAAGGYPGNLMVEKARSALPNLRFLIIEPMEGIPSYLADKFLNEEEIYSKTLQKKKIGTMQVWVQESR